MFRYALLLFPILVIVGCNSKQRKEAAGFTQGTTYSVIYFSNGPDLQYQIDSLLLDFDRVLSTYQESSYISKWSNSTAIGLPQPSMFKEVVRHSIEINANTNGAFDITVSPLMDYWFENDWKIEKVDSAKVDSLKSSIGMDKVMLQQGDYVQSGSSIRLDVNAIAQGYSVDVLSRYLESLGIFNYLVEIGGEVRADGAKDDGENWTVGIERPNDQNLGQELMMSVKLKGRSLATSGNYRKFIEINGQKFGHSLNPQTGYPATTNVLSATVIARDCMTADAYATALMVMGFEKAKQLVEQDSTLEAVLIYSENAELSTWQSDGVGGVMLKPVAE